MQDGDEFFCYLTGTPQHGGRQLLPTVQLGERLYGLRLPATPKTIGATLNIMSVLGGARARLVVSGTEFWPARAAGFGLHADDDGRVRVVSAGRSAQHYSKIAYHVPRMPRPAGFKRDRLVSAVKSVPVAGPALTGAVRRVKSWRS